MTGALCQSIERRSSAPLAGAGARDAGFTLVEVLIAGVLVLAIAVTTVPMFTQALANNTAGMDSTEVANEARGQLERLVELPFSSPELTLSSGAERRTSEYFSLTSKTWRPFPLPAGGLGVLWTRVTVVRQYSLSAIADGVLNPAEAVAWDTVPEAVHLKEIEIQVEQNGAAFGPSKRIGLKTLKVK